MLAIWEHVILLPYRMRGITYAKDNKYYYSTKFIVSACLFAASQASDLALLVGYAT